MNSLPPPHPATDPTNALDGDASLAQLEVRLDEALFERDLACQTVKRLEREMRHLERQVARAQSDNVVLRNRLDERERYIAALHGSKGWKFLQGLRSVFGRRW